MIGHLESLRDYERCSEYYHSLRFFIRVRIYFYADDVHIFPPKLNVDV
jgi:hypothetical protein